MNNTNDNNVDIKKMSLAEFYRYQYLFDEQQNYHYNLCHPCPEKFMVYTFEKLQQAFNEDSIIFFVLFINNNAVGFATLDIGETYHCVGDLFLQEKYRGMGYGRKLLETVICYHNQYINTHLGIELSITIGNEKAMAFYEKLGFRLSGYKMFLNT